MVERMTPSSPAHAVRLLDIENALKLVPVSRLPAVYEFIVSQTDLTTQADYDAEARWQETLAQPRSQAWLDHMADEALAELREGKALDLDALLQEDTD